MALLIAQVASQRTWPAVGDIDDCWILAWQMSQIAVAPWLPWLDTTTARRYAGDPDDGNADGNDRGVFDMLRGIRAATPKLGELVRPIVGMSWAELLPLIKVGRPFAAAVIGSALPKVYTSVPHQVVLYMDADGGPEGRGLRCADPMAPDRSTPYRIPTASAAAACAAFAGAGRATGVLFPTIAEAFPTHPLYVAPSDAIYTEAQYQAGIAAAAAPLLARIEAIKAESATSAGRIATL